MLTGNHKINVPYTIYSLDNLDICSGAESLQLRQQIVFLIEYCMHSLWPINIKFEFSKITLTLLREGVKNKKIKSNWNFPIGVGGSPEGSFSN